MRWRSRLLLFPNLTQLDRTGPYEVLERLPEAETPLLAKSLDPVRSGNGLTILPQMLLADCPALDLVLVPGCRPPEQPARAGRPEAARPPE
jgi:cyclohexyl-isocyanide hydratase